MTSVKRRAVSDAQKAQRREDILNSARELFQNCSRYDAILMKHIAENIKLTKGTLYLYFKTKEEVFLALYEQEFLTLCQRMQSAVLAHAKNRKAGLGAEELQDVFVSAVAGQDTFPASEWPTAFRVRAEHRIRYRLTIQDHAPRSYD